MKPRASADLVTLSQGQSHLKWYKMTEVNGAYNQYMHGKYERTGLKSFHVVSIVKPFAKQDGLGELMNMTDDINPYGN